MEKEYSKEKRETEGRGLAKPMSKEDRGMGEGETRSQK